MKLEVVIFKKLSEYDLDVCFESHEDRLGLMGPSGSGKSMVLKCIAGIMTPDAGRIVLDDEVLFDSDLKINISPQKRKIGYMFQNYALFDHMNVYQNIAAPLKAHHEDKQVIKEKVQQIMKDFQIGDLQKRYPRQLSGGQKQRIAMARALVHADNVLILDEATSNIDVESEEKVWESIYKLAKNKTVIVISHRLANVKNADSIYILDKGHIVENGKHKELMMSKNKYYELVTHQANLENIYKEDVEIEEVAVNE